MWKDSGQTDNYMESVGLKVEKLYSKTFWRTKKMGKVWEEDLHLDKENKTTEKWCENPEKKHKICVLPPSEPFVFTFLPARLFLYSQTLKTHSAIHRVPPMIPINVAMNQGCPTMPRIRPLSSLSPGNKTKQNNQKLIHNSKVIVSALVCAM